jgi:hypothetical protein
MTGVSRILSATLLVSLLVTLAGCETLRTALRPSPTICVAAKPTLNVVQTADGGIQLDRDDTARLLIYIEQLRKCARQGG